MKKPASVVFATVLVLAGTVLAESPVGSISSMGPVEIDGSQLSASTVPTWPIANGDEIRTINHPAVIFLKDKSRITVNSRSKIRLTQTGDGVAVHLLDGSVFYSLQSNSSAAFLVGPRGVPANLGLRGSLSAAGASSAVPANMAFPGVAAPSVDPITPGQLKFATSQMTVSRRPAPSNVNPF